MKIKMIKLKSKIEDMLVLIVSIPIMIFTVASVLAFIALPIVLVVWLIQQLF